MNKVFWFWYIFLSPSFCIHNCVINWFNFCGIELEGAFNATNRNVVAMLHIRSVSGMRTVNVPSKIKNLNVLKLRYYRLLFLWPRYSLWLQEYLNCTWNKVFTCWHHAQKINFMTEIEIMLVNFLCIGR